MRALTVLLAAALTLLLAPQTAVASELLAHERYTLANGLEVVLQVDRTLPLIAVDLSYHVGAGHDGDKPGLAHLCEHLMFRGTRDVDDGQYFGLVTDAGGHSNGHTHIERSAYVTTLPANQLPLILWLESNRMAWLLGAIDRAKVAEEIRTTSDEYRYRIGSQRRGGDVVDLSAALYADGHPWAPASPERIAQLTLADVREFVERYHGPANATLVLAGDLPEDVHEQIEHYFGRRRGGVRATLPKPSAKPPSGELRIVRKSEFATNPAVMVAWPSPAQFGPGDAEADVLARVIEHRLWTEFEAAKRTEILAVYAHQSSEVVVSQFNVTLEGSSSTTPERLLAALDAALAQLGREPIRADELDRARRGFQLDAYRALQSLAARVGRMQLYIAAGKPPDWLDQDLARYDAIDLFGLDQIRAELLDPERRTVVLAHPAKQGRR